MDDRDNRQDDFFSDSRALFNPAERDCIQTIEEEDDLLERLQNQREAALERLWSTFQNAASSLAQLYKERPTCDCCQACSYRQNNHDRWLPFQGAANRVTHLYRDGTEALRAGIELGYHAGYQRRNRDITNWTKKKRKTIRREDILSHLSGRSPPRRKSEGRNTGNTLSLSPKPPPTMENDLLTLGENKDFDFTAFMEGRNPFTEGGRKRHNYNDITMHESPHKRGRFC